MTTTIHAASWARDLATDIRAAKSTIVATALSLLPPRTIKPDDFSRLWLALADAATRGVGVTFILPAPTISHPATQRNESAAFALRSLGAAGVLVPPTRLLHAKTVLIDDAVAWLGSGNWTAAAAHHNREIYARTTDPIALLDIKAFHVQQLHDALPTP